MELVHRQVSRYAAFTVESETEALAALSRASEMMYASPPKYSAFNEDGFLTGIETPDPEEPGQALRFQDSIEFVDETIHLAIFENVSLLTIELYDELMDPNEPLHSDNIVLAKQMEKLALNSTESQQQ
jgi:hypothetical protein